MMKSLIAGLWICMITVTSCYGALTWLADTSAPEKEDYLEGVQYKKLPSINVPIIADGSVQGYVVANLVFTADAKSMQEYSALAEAFLRDETFRYIYSDEHLDFKRLSKYDVSKMTDHVKSNVNKRLGHSIIKDVLVENFIFVNRSDIRS